MKPMQPTGEARTIPPHEIIVLPPVGQARRDELFQQCCALRMDVFHREQNFPAETEIDGLEETSTHFLLRLVPSLMPVGTIRAAKREYYKLTRLAVLKDYRMYGFGLELVMALHDWVKEDAASKGHDSVQIACHSQIPAKGFYEKCGYQPVGEEFEEEGAPHQKMVIRHQLPHISTS